MIPHNDAKTQDEMTPVSLAGQATSSWEVRKLNADHPRLQDSVAKPLCNLIPLFWKLLSCFSSDHLII